MKTLTIEAHKQERFCTTSIVPTFWNYCTTVLISILVIRLPGIPFFHISQWLIAKGPTPAIDVIIESDPCTGIELLSLRFILKLDHVVMTFDDRQVNMCGLAVSLSITPCFPFLNQLELMRYRQDEEGESCGVEKV